MEGVVGALRCEPVVAVECERDRPVGTEEAEEAPCVERKEDVDGEAALWV